MNPNAALAWADALLFERTGDHLNGLQTTILRLALTGQRYFDIAQQYGCTEGHAKDAGAELWKGLSQSLGERVTKANFKTVFERHCLGREPLPSGANDGSRSLLMGTDRAGVNANFVGRDGAIAHLNHWVGGGMTAIVIQGEGGVGKTTLAQQYIQSQGFDRVLEWLMAKEIENLTPVEGVVEEWLKRDFEEEPGREFGVTLARLKRHLRTQRIGILIDNLEPALNRDGRLIDSHRSYVELLRVLADDRNQSVTLITSRDRLCEEGITVAHYRLPGLAPEAWRDCLESHQIHWDDITLNLVHRTYGGNAKAMQILCGVVREDFDGDMIAYWQENGHDPLQSTALRNLVVSQMTRLLALDSDAYRLLCRLGCYRFQEIATIPKAGLLAQLWDVDPHLQAQVIQSLRNRSLLESHRGRYWLHPVIRAEAIAQLRLSHDWEKASRAAANFWTQSVTTIVTVDDALSAWEAYYHWIDIHDFEAASQVILQSRHNQWQQFLPLGSLFYRMGLIQPVLSAIHAIVDHVQSDAKRSELNNILGDLYWTTGHIQKAIAYQETSLLTARSCLERFPALQESATESLDLKPIQHQQYYLRMLEIDSLLSLGLYNIDLWELDIAAYQLQQVITLGKNTAHHRWAEKAAVCLALVKSYLGQGAEALALIEEIHRLIVVSQKAETMGRFAYFIQLLGQTFVNLGELEIGRDLYQSAIAFAENSHYLQVKANALTGLGEIYRCQGKMAIAVSAHQDAIQLLEDIGAKCDLARAYHQFGLTTIQLGDSELAMTHLAVSLQLFSTIDAPRQVQRVQELIAQL